MKLFEQAQLPPSSDSQTFVLPNDADPRAANLTGVHTIVLQFPAFTDGRAFSQAFLLRRRLGFTGTIRATGDVLVDQLVQMARTGFTEAVLADGQNLAVGQRLLDQANATYQGDAVIPQPRFASSSTLEAA